MYRCKRAEYFAVRQRPATASIDNLHFGTLVSVIVALSLPTDHVTDELLYTHSKDAPPEIKDQVSLPQASGRLLR